MLVLMQKEADKWKQKKSEEHYKLTDEQKERIRGPAAREICRQLMLFVPPSPCSAPWHTRTEWT